jgi:hypothetical protein
MTTHRGNGANTALLDSLDLTNAVLRIITREARNQKEEEKEGINSFWQKELEKFEVEMMKRGKIAVEESLSGMMRMHSSRGVTFRNWFIWTIGRVIDLYYALTNSG